jgi:hypothetical protein
MSRAVSALIGVVCLAGIVLAVRLVAGGRVREWGPIQAAAGPVLWRLDPSSTAVDGDGRRLYGLGGRRYSRGVPDYYRDERIAGGCPTGGDSVRFVFTGFDGQRYVGGGVATPAPEWGESRTLRGRIKYHMGRRDAVHTQKLVIIGDSGGGNRPILTIGTHLGEPAPLTIALQIDGGAHTISSAGLRTDAWHAWEMVVNPGQPTGGGWYTLTVTGKLAGTEKGLTFSERQRQSQGEAGIGFYMNDPVAPNDDFWFELCDVEIAR